MSKIGNELFSGLQTFKYNVRLIWSSSQLIDFFMHDMLDFAIFYERKKKIMKTNEVFCLREALEFLFDIFKHKVDLLEINLELDLTGLTEARLKNSEQRDDDTLDAQ